MKLRVGFLVCALGVANCAAIGSVVGIASVGTAGAATAKSCGAVTVKGYTVRVSATSVSCSNAKKWAPGLVKKSIAAHRVRSNLSGGPSGWTCIGGVTKTAALTEVTGNCSKGGLGSFGGGPYFNWSGSQG